MAPRSLALGLVLSLTACAPDGPRTVVVVTFDATSARILLGNDDLAWDVSPRIHEYFQDASVFTHTLTSRGLTSPALATMLTGEYPLVHGVKDNKGTSPVVPTLLDAFHDQRYQVYGYLANVCHFVEGDAVDETVCTQLQDGEMGVQGVDQDETLVQAFEADMATLSDRKHVFYWLHFYEPHRSYQPIDAWYDEFHPWEYEGTLNAASNNEVDSITVGERGYDDEDRAYLEAVYASQVKSADDHFGRLVDAMKAAGRYDDAVLVFGQDHGQELAEHNTYFLHGCSPYNGVVRVVYAFKAPGVPGGQVFDGWVSTTDVAPTVAELVGLSSFDGVAGRSLVPTLSTGQESQVPVYFERGTDTAGVIDGSWKYFAASSTEFNTCPPYDTHPGTYYATDLEELYDLEADPAELSNLALEEPQVRQELRDLTCDWLLSARTPEDNPLVESCIEER